MKVLEIFRQQSKGIYLVIFLLGTMNSLFHGGLLVLINSSISQKPFPVLPEYDWLIFIFLVAGSIIVGRFFQARMIRLTHDTLYHFEISLLKKLRYAFYENFKKVGDERVYTAIGDARVLARAPEVLLSVFNALIITTCGIFYMFWNSILGGITILGVMIFLLVFYMYRNNKIEVALNRVRDLENLYFKYLRDFLFGFKEIKMSVVRNKTIFEDFLKDNRQKGKGLGIEADIQYMNNEITGNASWYVVIGLVLFGLPILVNADSSVTTSFLVTALYLMGPITTLIVFLPFMTRSKIALERMESLEKDINSTLSNQLQERNDPDLLPEFKSLTFKDITYQYKTNNDENAFLLGPVNLQIKKGEVLFITGGNGSGKSTFINILTGLYKPTDGEIFLNDKIINENNYNQYRNKMSAIFTDNYLFDENYNQFDLNSSNQELMGFLKLMELSTIVKIDEEREQIRKDLSKGQQKRLAMVYALMENRQIIVLDEWAAEQDPEFRKFFYTELIPHFKSIGKTILAITHDDAYYDMGDRIIRFEYGTIQSDQELIPLVNSRFRK